VVGFPQDDRWSSVAVLLLLALLAALFLGRQLFFGLSLVPFDLLPGTTPWKQLHLNAPPPWNPLLDSLQQYYPRRVFFNESLRAGFLPLWNPDVYTGMPFLATQQAAVLYPPAWLLALLPVGIAFTASAWFHLALAAAGTFLLLAALGLHRAAAFTGAVAFAFNGFMVAWLAYPNVSQWTWAWLPLILYTVERALGGAGPTTPSLRWVVIAAALIGLQFLGGHAQISAYLLIAVLAYALATGLSGPRLAGTHLLALSLLAGTALAAAHLLPAWEYAPQTDRGARVPWESLAGNAFPAGQLVAFLVPRFFGDGTLAFEYGYWGRLSFVEMTGYPGAVTLALAAAGLGAAGWQVPAPARGGLLPLSAGMVAGFWGWVALAEPIPLLGVLCFVVGAAAAVALLARLARAGGRARLGAYFLGIALLGLAMAMRSPLYWPLWRFLPGFAQFTAVGRAICLVGWGTAGLAALGVDALLCRDAERPAAARGALAGAGLLCLGLAAAVVMKSLEPGAGERLARVWLPIGLAVLWLALAGGLAGLAARGLLPAARLGLLAAGLVTADLFTFGAGYNPAADPALAEVRTPELDFLAAAPEPYRFYSYGQPGPAAFRDRMSPNLPSVFGIPDVNGSDSFFPRRYLETMAAIAPDALDAGFQRPEAPAFAALGARYLLRPGEAPPPGFRPAAGRLWENPRALPYARVQTAIRAFPTPERLLAELGRMDPAAALVLGDDPPLAPGLAPGLVPRARLERAGPNRLRLELAAPAPGLAVVAEAYNAGWRARVDGQPAAVIPVDHLIMGTPVPAGYHRVEFRYEPATFRAGLFLSLLAAAALAAALAAHRFMDRGR
jgi:hypothetical protein